MKNAYFYLICLLTVMDAVLLTVSVSHREKKAVKAYIVIVALIIVAQVFYGASLIIPSRELKFFVHELKFLGVAYFSTCFYIMYMQIFDKPHMLDKKYIALLMIIPTITVVLAITNNHHHLFREQLNIIDNEIGSFIGVRPGPFYNPYIVYSYAVYIFVIGVALKAYMLTPRIYRMQIGIMIFAAASTLVVNYASIFGLLITDLGDATLISFTIAAAIQFYGLVLYKPTEMIRMARDMAVNETKAPIIIFDYEDRFLDANAAARELFSFEPVRTYREFLSEVLGIDETADTVEVERNGMWYSVRLRRVADDDGVFTVSAILLNNITELKVRMQELDTLATHDYLTGMANRHAYLRKLKTVRESDLPLAVIHFNIVSLKSINRTLGHEAGDSAIRRVVDALASVAGDGFSARLGGDEFALLLSNTTKPMADGIISELKERLEGIGISCGLAIMQSTMDNINIIDKLSMDNMYMNKLLAHSVNISRER